MVTPGSLNPRFAPDQMGRNVALEHPCPTQMPCTLQVNLSYPLARRWSCRDFRCCASPLGAHAHLSDSPLVLARVSSTCPSTSHHRTATQDDDTPQLPPSSCHDCHLTDNQAAVTETRFVIFYHQHKPHVNWRPHTHVAASHDSPESWMHKRNFIH